MTEKKFFWRGASAYLRVACALIALLGSLATGNQAASSSGCADFFNGTRPYSDTLRGHGLTAMVTGGAGFIGSMAKACLKLGFARVIVVDDFSGG